MNLYSISTEYRDALDDLKCKKEGIYYTPELIVKLMVKELFKDVSISENIKILDIASGCGLFYNEVVNYFLGKKKNSNSCEVLDIICKSLYAIEKDKVSVEIFREYNKKKYINFEKINSNILLDDALFPQNEKIKEGMFDYIIGNPPYVGHKNIDSQYSKKLREEYKDVYINKSDIYYCFFKRAVDYLKEGGICSYIVPRYFLESDSALHVRKFLEKNTEIINIFDFRSCEIFSKNIGVSPAIITFKKKTNSRLADEEKNVKTKIINNKEDLEDLLRGKNINSSGVLFKDETSWAVMTKDEKMIMDAIKNKLRYKLADIVDSYQGVITGCDRAFIIDNKSELLADLDSSLCKRWIKSKDILSYNIKENNKILLYLDTAKSLEDGKLKTHLLKYRDRLEGRREVIKGIRSWYHLQWARKESSFEQEKIIYPFKSKENRFALDKDNSYFSADVYFFTIKEEFKSLISYPYLLTILNSKVYQTYMQAFLKKMGNSIYEYYPYRLLETYIFLDENYKILENIGKEILDKNNKSRKEDLIKKVDRIIEKSLNLTDFNER